MSSSEGLKRLKNWQRTGTALKLPEVSLKGDMRVFEDRVKVAFVDESTLVLVNLEVVGETAALSLRGTVFRCTDEATRDLEITFEDGKKVYLREED